MAASDYVPIFFKKPLALGGASTDEYSLRQGIEDGFLAPYRVHRVITEWDAAGWRPHQIECCRETHYESGAPPLVQ